MPLQNKPTEKQILAIYLTLPGPIGLGSKEKDAAKLMGITHGSFWNRLRCLKKYFPEAYENYQSMRRAMRRQRSRMQKPRRLGKGDLLKIVEKF